VLENRQSVTGLSLCRSDPSTQKQSPCRFENQAATALPESQLNMKTPHDRRTHLITAVLAALALGTSLGSAQAAIFKDAQLESLHEDGKFAELEQHARTRLKTNPADAEASAALVLGLSFADPADAKRLEAGAQQAKLCTDSHPEVAVCHLAAAQNLSLQMLNMGMAQAMRSVGSLKDVWTRTLALEPTSFTARVQLAKLYLVLPVMMGGSTSQAKELEAAVRGSQPETARIIRAHIAGEAKQWAEMEAELLALKPTNHSAMRREVREATMQLALNFLKDGKDLAKAKRQYESLQRDQPRWADGFYGAARVQAALGAPDEAIRLFERARNLNGADEYPIDHRLGDTLLAKGDKAQAKAVYERFIANKRAKPANVEEVRKRLAKLG
jgi:tetratricopeptide (TPR) repeat protein